MSDFDTYAWVRAWEGKQTARLPSREEWPTVRAELNAILRAAGEALRTGENVYNPPVEHGDIGTP